MLRKVIWLLPLLMFALVYVGFDRTKVVVVSRSIELYAATTGGDAIAGLRAWADGSAIGETDSRGALTKTLRSVKGGTVTLTWACPVGYRAQSERRNVMLDGGDSAASKRGDALTPLLLKVICEPLEQLAALVVRVRGAPQAGLPIQARDEVVGRTDPDGIAHVLLRVRPKTTLTIGLDTSAYPELVPQNPIETFQLGSEESVLLLDRTLTIKKREPKKKRSPPRIRNEPHRPYKIH